MPETLVTRRRSFLNLDVFNTLCDERGWTRGYQRATGIGVSPAAISRATNGQSLSAAFVVGCLAVFGAAECSDLFRNEEVAQWTSNTGS